MKKLLFTVQMVALIAIFPVYLIAALSQEKIKSPVKNPASAIEKVMEGNNVQVTSVNAHGQFSFLIIK